ncbi:hypothetical protein SUGI_0079420 [Cryptomeria japonica]|nr:hypothetical protein SUGI_0079420 [Cryptomeria japonica]
MDYQIPLHCKVIPNDNQSEKMISLPTEDNTGEQSKLPGDAEFRDCNMRSSKSLLDSPQISRFPERYVKCSFCFCTSKLGKCGLGSIIRILRYVLQDATFSLTFLVLGLGEYRQTSHFITENELALSQSNSNSNYNDFFPSTFSDNENRFLPRQHISTYDNFSGRTKICREREAFHFAFSSVSMVMMLILALLTIVSIVVARDHLFPNDTVVTICSETQKCSVAN